MSGLDALEETLVASGLPPLLSRRHSGDDLRGFRAGIVTRDLGPLRLAELVTPAAECFRDARSARAVDSELWQVDLVTRGHVRAEQGGSTAVLGPADLVLLDPERPVRFASTATRSVTILVPRRSLRLRPDDVARLTGVRIRGDRGPGALVSSLARDVARSLTGFRADEAARSAAAVVELVAVALSAQLGDSRPAPAEALRDRIVGFIEARLSDRDLTPAKVAAAHHMSVRRLHKLFEDEPMTVAGLIRQRRLERCHADLAGTDRTVAAVAARWGSPIRRISAGCSRPRSGTTPLRSRPRTVRGRSMRPPVALARMGLTAQKGDRMEQSVEAMSAIPARMNEAWNRGDATAFFADFAEDAVFADWEGTIHRGRAEMIATHQPIFDTVVKGSRLVGSEVPFALVIRPGWGVVHHRMSILMPGEEEPLPTRYSMQLFVLAWQNDRWEVTALQNARVLSLDTAMALDSLAAAR